MRDNFEQFYYRCGEIDKKILQSEIRFITSIARKYIHKPLGKWSVLDVGCGIGRHSFLLERKVKKIVALEPFKKAFDVAIKKKRKLKSKVTFVNLPVEKYKSKQRFDLILCLTTIEHMPNPKESFANIFRLLGKDGLIYISLPNKLWPFEYHYRLPFLSWLPLSLANLYVKTTGRGKSFEDSSSSMTYLELKRFLNSFSCKYEFIVPSPEEKFLGLGKEGSFYNVIKNVGLRCLKNNPFLWNFSKAFIVVVQKNEI